MGSTEWTLFLCCLGVCIGISQSSTCSHAQCVYDYVTAEADCSSLNLDCIPVNYPHAIIMDLSHNIISELSPDDFNGTFSRLAELYLDYNNVSDVTSLLESSELDSLQIVSVKHNLISYLPSTCQLSSLTELSVDYNSITSLFYIPHCGTLLRISADFNLIDYFYVTLYNDRLNTDISLQFNRLTYVRFYTRSSYGGRPTSFFLDHNKIQYLEFQGPYLSIDICSLTHNQLQGVSIGATPDTLNVGSNGLSNWNNIDLAQNGNTMKRLDMSNNSFDSLIQPYWAEGLEFLNADTNLLANLSSTTLSRLFNLTELHVANNRLLFISSTALSQLTMLRSLYLDDNALTSLFGVFFNQSILFELSITNNRLTTLHADYFMGLLSLKRLYLAGNQLTSVNMLMFQLVPEIINLDLSQNELQLVDLQDCPLINLTNLQDLSLAHNLIHDAETILGFCDYLQVLDLSYNLIQVVPGDSLSGRNRALSKLELEGNPLQCDCRLTGLRDWLRNNPPYVEPRCEGPNHYYGSVITDLDSHDFLCQAPMAMVDKQLTALAGKSVTLICTATGIPAPTVTWLSPNDTEILAHDEGRFTILRGQILHITPVEKHDEGRYTCLAHNILGEGRAEVNLTVTTSKSDAPQPHSLASSVLPTMFITIIITVAVFAGIIFLRRYRKKQQEANSTSASQTSDLKVGFSKGDNDDSEGGCVNKALGGGYEVPSGQQTTLRYADSPTTGRRQPSQTYAQTAEDHSGGNGENKGDEELYESVSDP
ncbi:uncharacterized protein [Asterias amurensis]|uniref:uncharacterized protein n=1 Tax=Asterias amurensis TaxID=7602 RepID=UPI003AB4B199